MTTTMTIDGAAGRVAIYTGSDDLPLANPLSYLSRVKFHSDLNYPAIIAEYSGVLSTSDLPSIAINTRRLFSHRVQAHGVSGIPWVIGSITVAGVKIACQGTVPVQMDSSSAGFSRWLALGADGTDIILYENGMNSAGTTMPAVSIAWRALVTNVVL